jgi:hypothetical protein
MLETIGDYSQGKSLNTRARLIRCRAVSEHAR